MPYDEDGNPIGGGQTASPSGGKYDADGNPISLPAPPEGLFTGPKAEGRRRGAFNRLKDTAVGAFHQATDLPRAVVEHATFPLREGRFPTGEENRAYMDRFLRSGPAAGVGAVQDAPEMVGAEAALAERALKGDPEAQGAITTDAAMMLPMLLGGGPKMPAFLKRLGRAGSAAVPELPGVRAFGPARKAFGKAYQEGAPKAPELPPPPVPDRTTTPTNGAPPVAMPGPEVGRAPIPPSQPPHTPPGTSSTPLHPAPAVMPPSPVPQAPPPPPPRASGTGFLPQQMPPQAGGPAPSLPKPPSPIGAEIAARLQKEFPSWGPDEIAAAVADELQAVEGMPPYTTPGRKHYGLKSQSVNPRGEKSPVIDPKSGQGWNWENLTEKDPSIGPRDEAILQRMLVEESSAGKQGPPLPWDPSILLRETQPPRTVSMWPIPEDLLTGVERAMRQEKVGKVSNTPPPAKPKGKKPKR